MLLLEKNNNYLENRVKGNKLTSENLLRIEFRSNIFWTHQFEVIHHKIIFNRINSLLAKSLKNFFLDYILLLLWTCGVFAPYLLQETVLCYTLFKIYYIYKKHSLTKLTNFCEKNSWNDKKCIFKVEMSVCVSMCPSVRVLTFEVPFKCLFCLHFPKLDANFLEIWNSCGKEVESSGLRFEKFCSKMV